MKLKEHKWAVILSRGYNFVIVEEIDFETQKSFGLRGHCIDACRYKISTGQMYSKNSPHQIYDSKEKAEQFRDKCGIFTETIRNLEDQIRSEREKLANFVRRG